MEEAYILWQSKITSGGIYENMPPCQTFGVDEEDLDNNSYRSITSGNLIDTIVSKSWVKIKMGCDRLTFEEMKSLLTRLRVNPLYINIKLPLFNTDTVEYKVRCSKKSYDLNQDGTWKVSFNLVQKTKVSGQ